MSSTRALQTPADRVLRPDPAINAAGNRLASMWGDRGVKTKVLLAVGVAAVSAAAVGAMGLTSLSSAAEKSQDIYGSNLSSVAAVGRMQLDITDMRIASRDATLSPDSAGTATALQAIPTALAQFRTDEDTYTSVGMTPAKQDLVDQVDAVISQWSDYLDSTLAPLAEANDFGGWIAANAQGPQLSDADALLDELEDLETTEAAAAAQSAADSASSATTTVLVVLAVGLTAAVAVGLLVATGIARGLRRVQDVAQALAGGDLTRRTGLATRDEVGQVGAALDTALADLTVVMSSVVGSADAVAASSEELSASAAQISASAEETSVQSTVVSGAAEEVSRSVATVAAGAEQMSASIREIAQNANEAARVAAGAVVEAETTNATITKLGVSSKEIGDVIKVITSIAEQTNLLALNATIEAARAGEAGKGFAVVANEVKELAQETARATEDIARRVEAIQTDTTGAVAAIGRISAVIEEINSYQLTIASAVEEQTATTNEMSRSVAEAAGGTTEIAGNITGVSDAAGSTTQALGQTRLAVDELSRMATGLRTTVARFTY